MKVTATFAGVLAAGVATLMGAAAANAATVLIDFGGSALGATTYTGATLEDSSALNFPTATWVVTTLGSGDMSGLALGGDITFTSSGGGTTLSYGSGSSGSTDWVKTWSAGGNTYVEDLTTVTSINRSSPNSIGLDLSGTLTINGGAVQNAYAIITANQVGGPGKAVSVSFTNSSVSAAIPESSTWAMMGLGFMGLGFAGFRGSRKAISIA